MDGVVRNGMSLQNSQGGELFLREAPHQATHKSAGAVHVLSGARDVSVDCFNVYNAARDVHIHQGAADHREEGK